MASQAAILIAQLQAQGYSKAAIARQLGRDASIVSQISNGKKSGASYVPALQQLVSGTTQAVHVERRKNKSGSNARVRGGAIRDENNRVINLVTKAPNGTQVTNLLKNIERNNGLIGVVITFRKYQAYEMSSPVQMDIPIWSNGTSAKWILATMRNEGISFSELLIQQVRRAYDPTIATNIYQIQINAVY